MTTLDLDVPLVPYDVPSAQRLVATLEATPNVDPYLLVDAYDTLLAFEALEPPIHVYADCGV